MIKKIKKWFGIGGKSHSNVTSIDMDYIVDVPNVPIVDNATGNNRASKATVSFNSNKPVKPRKGCKVNTRNPYLYYPRNGEHFFKTEKAANHIPISSAEAVKIIELRKAGFTYQSISEFITFERSKVNAGTIRNWVDKYNLGLMDKSLFWICKNDVGVSGKKIEDVLHSKVGDI